MTRTCANHACNGIAKQLQNRQFDEYDRTRILRRALDLFPAVVPPMREIEHFSIFARVAVRVDDRVMAQVVLLSNALRLRRVAL